MFSLTVGLVIDRAFAKTRVGAILLLVFGIQFGVEHRYFHFVSHLVYTVINSFCKVNVNCPIFSNFVFGKLIKFKTI